MVVDVEWLKVVVPAAAIFAGVWQFLHGQAAQRRRDFENRLWSDQRQTYMQVAKVVGKAAADPKQAAALYPEFMALYWGEMIFVEEEVCEAAMVEFEAVFRLFAQKKADAAIFQEAAYALIKTLVAESTRRMPRN